MTFKPTLVKLLLHFRNVLSRDVEAEARKIHRFRFYIGGKNGGRKEIGSAILRRRTNRDSISFKKSELGGVV